MPAIITTPPVSLTYQQTILADGPIGYWPMDDIGTPPTQSTDVSVNNYDLTVVTSTSLSAAQPPLVNGSTYSTQWTSTAQDNTGFMASTSIYAGASLPLTMEMWIRMPSLINWHYLFATHKTPGFSFYRGLHAFIDSNGAVEASYGNGGGVATSNRRSYKSANGTFLANTDTHMVLTFPDTTTCKLYVNNSLISMPYLSGGAVTFDASSGQFAIGRAWENGTGSFYGFIDEVAFYNYELTAQQVANHYNAGI